MNEYTFQEWTVRADMIRALERYIERGLPVGDFLTGVLENDLFKACSHADSNNKRNLPAFVGYLYNKAPQGCWGSKENVRTWIAHDGLKGVSYGVEYKGDTK